MNRSYLYVALAAVALVPACSGNKAKTTSISTAPVTRRDIIIDAQANGAVEPINIVEVKSKASGMITKMTVETGSLVTPGDLLVQVDTRDVRNQYNQADADVRAAEAKIDVSLAQKKRSDEMFAARVITAQEHETAALDYANAQAAVVRARANLDLAKQRLEDATVTAPVVGTIIEKTVSEGMVITSATGSLGAGTTLLKMADLSRVRMRAQFNETDIGQIRSGQPAIVVVDAYPDRRFNGVVEKIEPQAVVNQGVTMFPVLVTLSNTDGALRPGMNGEVSVQIEQKLNVLSVPIEAVKNTREAVAMAPLLGLSTDSAQARIRAQFQSSGRGFGGGATGQRGNSTSANGQRVTTSPGEVASVPQQGAPTQGGNQGGFQMPDVSDKECAAVKTAMDRKPSEVKKLDDLRSKVRSGELDRNAMREEQQKIYAAIGVDARIAGACRMQEMRANGGGQFGNEQFGANQQTGASTSAAAAGRAPQSNATGDQPRLQLGNTERGGTGPRVRPGMVFVQKGRTFEPRIVMTGSSNFDYTEIVSGLQEGEQVALLASLSLQAQRQQQQDRLRQGMGGVPGMSQTQTPGAGNAGQRGGRQ